MTRRPPRCRRRSKGRPTDRRRASATRPAPRFLPLRSSCIPAAPAAPAARVKARLARRHAAATDARVDQLGVRRDRDRGRGDRDCLPPRPRLRSRAIRGGADRAAPARAGIGDVRPRPARTSIALRVEPPRSAGVCESAIGVSCRRDLSRSDGGADARHAHRGSSVDRDREIGCVDLDRDRTAGGGAAIGRRSSRK